MFIWFHLYMAFLLAGTLYRISLNYHSYGSVGQIWRKSQTKIQTIETYLYCFWKFSGDDTQKDSSGHAQWQLVMHLELLVSGGPCQLL